MWWEKTLSYIINFPFFSSFTSANSRHHLFLLKRNLLTLLIPIPTLLPCIVSLCSKTQELSVTHCSNPLLSVSLKSTPISYLPLYSIVTAPVDITNDFHVVRCNGYQMHLTCFISLTDERVPCQHFGKKYQMEKVCFVLFVSVFGGGEEAGRGGRTTFFFFRNCKYFRILRV